MSSDGASEGSGAVEKGEARQTKKVQSKTKEEDKNSQLSNHSS